jgi:hypothetical protein
MIASKISEDNSVSVTTLQHLITHAIALGGENLCAEGHNWVVSGGRLCPNRVDRDWECSQPVFLCATCGEIDYGIGSHSPGNWFCLNECDNSQPNGL